MEMYTYGYERRRAIARTKCFDSFFNFGIIYIIVVIEVIKALTAMLVISNVIVMLSIVKPLLQMIHLFALIFGAIMIVI